MPRHGAVSKGCKTCRQRKIKCDRIRPRCNPCIKAGWDCPGYGDVQDRMFQIQSVEDFDKAMGHGSSRSRDVEGLESASVTSTWSNGSRAWSADSSPVRLSPHPMITQPLNDRATNLFFGTYVLKNPETIWGFYEYLPTVFNGGRAPELTSDKALLAAVHAVSMAAYANTFHSSSLMNQALLRVGRTLRLLNVAVACPEEAIKDSTLIAIILLTTFESLTSRHKSALLNNEAHIAGATAIIRLRGHQQFKSRLGLQVFLQVTSKMLADHLQRAERLPVEILQLREVAKAHLDQSDPAWRLAELVVQLINFRASVREGILPDDISIVREALRIDGEFRLLAEDTTRKWKVSFCETGNVQIAWGGVYHIYPDLMVAHIWNQMRTNRLLLNAEVCRRLKTREQTLLSLVPEMDLASIERQRQTATDVVAEMVEGICGSIPQFLGHSSRLVTAGAADGNIAPSAGTYFLLGPLFNAGLAATEDGQRAWIIDRLRYIARGTGIMHAAALADSLEKEGQITS